MTNGYEMTRRGLLTGVLATWVARIGMVGVGAMTLAQRVAIGPTDRAWTLAHRLGATLFTQPGMDYATRTGYIGYFTDKVGRVVAWLHRDGSIYRTVQGSPVLARDARGYEAATTYMGKAW